MGVPRPRKKTVAQQRPKTCPRCGRACADKDALARHKALIHPAGKQGRR